MAEGNDFSLVNPINTVEFVVPPDPEDEGATEYKFIVGRFSFVKSLTILESLGRLAGRVDIGSMFVGGFQTDVLIDKLPTLLTEMRPTVLRIFALILIKNKRFEQLADDEEAMDAALRELRPVVASLDVNKAAELLQLGIERIGIQDIRKNFPMLLAALRA